MKTTQLTFALLAVLGFAATGCTAKTAPQGTVSVAKSAAPRDVPSSAALVGAVSSNNAFALALYDQVVSASSGGNVLASPLSASLALTMAYAGAKGQTATEMASALHLTGDSAAIFDGQNALSQALAGRAAAALASDQRSIPGSGAPSPSASDYAVQVVNSFWGQRDYPWSAPFLDVLAKSYGSGVYLEDFSRDPAAAASAINGWVSDATADKINGLLGPKALSSDTRIVLVNAVHLKLPWQFPFQASQTASGAFTRGDGTKVTASFMHQDLGEASYTETDQAQTISLPLSGGQLSVVFALPKNGLANLATSLTPTTWATMTQPGFAEVSLSLPKFDFTTESFSLAKSLQALGMKTAFTDTADFSGMSGASDIRISDVLQKAMMAVTETGVEAAAATAVIGVGTAAPVTHVTLSFDHPFLVSIVDQSGAIVFLGQIDDPTDAGSK